MVETHFLAASGTVVVLPFLIVFLSICCIRRRIRASEDDEGQPLIPIDSDEVSAHGSSNQVLTTNFDQPTTACVSIPSAGTCRQSQWHESTVTTVQEVIDKAWKARNKWYMLGLTLGIEQHNLDAIKITKRENVDDCFTEMIGHWLNQPGATWGKLVAALKNQTVGHLEIANSITRSMTVEFTIDTEDSISDSNLDTGVPESRRVGFECPLCGNCSIQQYLQGDCPNFRVSDVTFPYLKIDTRSLSEDDHVQYRLFLIDQTRSIRNDFFNLVCHLQNSLRKKISKDKLSDLSTRIIQATQTRSLKTNSIKDLMQQLLCNRYMSFINYHLLEYIVEMHGSNKDKKLLRLYLEDFKRYCQRSVFEVPRDIFHEIPPPSTDKFVFKVTEQVTRSILPSSNIFNDSGFPSNSFTRMSSETLNLSLDDTLIVQKEVAKALGVNVATVVFLGASNGCIELSFSIPKGIAIDSNTCLKLLQLDGRKDLKFEIMCGSPGKPYAIDVMESTVTIDWEKPRFQGSYPILYYEVFYQSVGDPQKKWVKLQDKPPGENAIVCTEVLPQTATFVTFKVNAVTNLGSGVQSEESDPVKLIPKTRYRAATAVISTMSVDEKLNIDSLQIVYDTVQSASDKWYEIGMKLGLNVCILDGMKEKFPNRGLRSMLRVWIQQENSTWKMLMTALNDVGYKDLSSSISTNLVTTIRHNTI